MSPTDVRSGRGASATLADAVRDFSRAWRPLVLADLLYKAIAFVALTPLIGLLLRWFVSRVRTAAVADVDIALFFFTTRSGATALILVSALALAVVALGNACLMTIGLGSARGARVRVRDAFAYGAGRAFAILRVTLLLVARVLILVAPFAAAAGATYWALLRGHDINYYLTDRPADFWAAVAIVAVILLLLAALLARKISGWVLTMPLVVFERILPVRAFGESERRMEGRRGHAAAALLAWAAVATAVPFGMTAAIQAFGRAAAPAFGGSLAGLLVFVGTFASVWGALSLAVNIVTTALFALIVLRLYLEAGPRGEPSIPVSSRDELNIGGRRFRVSWSAAVGGLAVAVLLASGLAYVVMRNAWTVRPVLVFAHRGASEEAPENTLAAFRRAGEERTDFVELDVQESSDGVVVVAHDSDLMKVARFPQKIWESTAEQLRAVDVGSYRSPDFKDERVPTLAEALAVCKGVSRVNIELKDYGHDQRLEERVAELVEAAGMQDQIVTMSLSRGMIEKMKRVRPSWTSGLLSAKAIGDLSRLPVDFLAVESKMATRRFIRSAHAANKPVYVWTVNDPQRMIRMIGLGVDGLITNYPGMAKEVLARYAKMTGAERLLLFVMTRLGAQAEITEPANDLRP